MVYLVMVSLVWAFSFGLIGNVLAGLDRDACALVRLVLALLVFLPFLRLRGLPRGPRLRLAGIGALQFGVMYVAYFHSFRYLQSWQVALLTITTPLYVTLCESLLSRRPGMRFHLAALLAVAGAAVIEWRRPGGPPVLPGILLVQASNLAFAAGQVLYRRLRREHPELSDHRIFALLYAGAAGVALLATLPGLSSRSFPVTWPQALVLVYLGVVASGVCFFLWNKGATRVGVGTLAAFNNVKIPLAVLCSLLLFRETADLPRLLAGSVLMALAIRVDARGGRGGAPRTQTRTPKERSRNFADT